VVEVGWKSFVVAEIPGLIKGAHRGRGLGHEFLRHAERTRLFIHLLDGTSSSLENDFRKVNDELVRYNPALLQKPQVVGVNKVDLPEVRARVSCLKGQLSTLNSPVFFISAVTREGVGQLMVKVAETLDSITGPEKEGEKVPEMVFRPRPKYYQPAVSKEDGVFLVSAPDLERLIARTDIDNAEGRQHLKRQFARLGVTRALRKAGIEAGDRVRLGEIEVEWD
jgi:GTP-binding protein